MTARRPFLTQPGEPLLVAPGPVAAALRFDSWLEFSGCTEQESLLSPMSAVPLPIYPEQWAPGFRRWEGTRPSAMWHPLMWLPDRVAARYSLTDSAGRAVVESDDLWAVRVGYELTATGLYDEATGTWLDALSPAGIDTDTDAGLNRVDAWLGGVPDPDLDGLDLTPIFDEVAAAHGSADWAIGLATAQLARLQVIAWASAADALLDHCDDLAIEAADDAAELRRGGSLMATLAGVSFAAIPRDGHDPSPGSEGQWWVALSDRIESFTGTATELTAGPISQMVTRLMSIHEAYWPQLEQLAAADA